MFRNVAGTVFVFFRRWFFMAALLTTALFCVFVWYWYIWKADWDEARKQQYISEQAKFSFDKNSYIKMVDLMETRQDRLKNFPRFEGRDIFFPD